MAISAANLSFSWGSINVIFLSKTVAKKHISVPFQFPNKDILKPLFYIPIITFENQVSVVHTDYVMHKYIQVLRVHHSPLLEMTFILMISCFSAQPLLTFENLCVK